jgi:hypothetical protein
MTVHDSEEYMSINITGQPWQNHSPQSNSLPVKGNHPFWYAVHPSNWVITYVGTGKQKRPVWIPAIRSLKLMAGTNGIRSINGQLDTSLFRANLMEKGWTILDPTKYDYMRVYPCQYGGSLHLDKNVKLDVLAGHLIRDTTEVYMAHCQMGINLILSGDIQPPHEHFLKLIIQAKKKVIPRHVQNQHIPELAAKYKALKDEVAEMEKALSLYQKQGIRVYEVKSNEQK